MYKNTLDGVALEHPKIAVNDGSSVITELEHQILRAMASRDRDRGAEPLSKALGIGRDRIQGGIKNLRNAGLIVTRTMKVGGKPIRVIEITQNGHEVLGHSSRAYSRAYIQQSQQNSYLNLNAYSVISKKEYLGEPREGEAMSDYEPAPMYLEPEERAEYNLKMRQRREAEYRAKKEQEAAEKIKAKSEKKPEDWSSDDSVYYFAERMSGMWHVKAWVTARTRFKGAYASARKTHGTTGDIELKMMERFFSGIEHQKHINDPEFIWKMFIKNYASILLDVERSTVTESDIESAKDLFAKQMEKF